MKFVAMKYLALILLSLSAFADDHAPTSYWSFHPLQAGGSVIGIGKADISETPLKGTIQFTKANTFAELLIPITPKTYLLPRADWSTFTMNWDKNPKFDTTQFYFAQFSLTFYSIDLEDWRWISRVQYNFDTDHFDQPGKYGLFSALLWGSYQINPQWHFHTGALGYVGLEGGQFYPIVGFDYELNKHWTFLAVFPIEYYVQYKFNKHWNIALKARPLKERFRAGENQPQPDSVFSYSTTGLEFNIHYEIFRRLEIDAFGGYSLGGSFYIKDSNGDNPLYTDVGCAPYGGASLVFGF